MLEPRNRNLDLCRLDPSSRSPSPLARRGGAESILHLGIDNQLCQAQDLSHKMESITKTRLFSFFRGQSFHGFEIEVVIKVEVSQVLSVNKQIQHVESLSADLKARFNPVNRGSLEKLGTLERSQKILFIVSFGLGLMQLVENICFQKLLVRDSDLDRLALWAVFEVPLLHQWHILSANHFTRTAVKWIRSP